MLNNSVKSIHVIFDVKFISDHQDSRLFVANISCNIDVNYEVSNYRKQHVRELSHMRCDFSCEVYQCNKCENKLKVSGMSKTT